MAQAITNTLKSTNSLQGLLGLNPKPLSSGVQTSTPATAGVKSLFGGTTSAPSIGTAQPVNISQNTPGLSFNSSSPGLVSTAQPAAKSAVAPATTAPVTSAPMTTPSGLPITGDPSTYAGVNPGNPTSTTPSYSAPGLFSSVTASLAGLQPNYADLAAKAQAIADEYGSKIADVGTKGARYQAGQLTTGTTPVAEGNAAVTARTTAAEQSALASGESAALQGVTAGISANQGAASALQSAGSLTQPYPTAYGQTSFSPDTGFSGGSSSLPPDVMQQYAQMAASGQYSAIPSFITSNPVLNAQLNVAAKALNPSYTPVGAQGASTVLQSIPALQSASAAAEGIKNTIVSYLGSNPQLNPSDLAAGNILQQWIQGKQLTDPKYQTLFNYLNEYTNTLAPILGVGGNPTDLKTQIAQSFINAAASGQSISAVLNAMSNLATNKIHDLQSGATGGGTSVPSPSQGGAGNITVQASDGNQYGFYQDSNGVWHSQ